MIDVHCHLEQKDYDKDRDEFIENLRSQIKAVITSCAHPKDFSLTLKIAEKYRNFVFATAGLHPEYIKELTEQQIKDYIEKIKENQNRIVAIGEIGLDYFWTKEDEWREKQRVLFRRMLSLAKELKKPVVIHTRDAIEDTIKILEEEKMRNVLIHLFGSKQFVEKIENNGWCASFGPLLLKSKTHKNIVKKLPLSLILLETDSPWFGSGKRGTPLNIKPVAEKIAEIKKMEFQDVWQQCCRNAEIFFSI